MGNLLNSMVRGFGSQVGRNVANNMMHSNNRVASKKQWIGAGVLLVLVVGLFVWAYMEGSKELKVTNQTEINKLLDSIPKVETYNGHAVYTGPRGGRYYYSKNGRKVYI